MSQIKELRAREILDSRGQPTVEAEVALDNGAVGRFAVPSGASTGELEALELRDKDPQRFSGKGVKKAIANIKEIIGPRLVGSSANDQSQIDRLLCDLDGTPNKSRLGANAILAVSMAVAKARGSLSPKEGHLLPVPLMNVINGGAHADNGLSIQEFMIVPTGAPNFAEAVRYGSQIFYALKHLLKEAGHSIAVGDEGGFAPRLASNHEAIEFLISAIEKTGLRAGHDVWIAIDAAASQFFSPTEKTYAIERDKHLNTAQMISYWKKLCETYPIISVEDALWEHDFQGFSELMMEIGHRVQVVGDDLFVTNPKLIKRGIAERAANAVLIKPNQIGTLSETLEAIFMAQAAGFGTIISHRSGETEDVTIADLAVATAAGQIKTGSLCRSERTAKYNQLLRIEESLGGLAKYAGIEAYRRHERKHHDFSL